MLYNAVPDREIGFQTERHQNSLPSVFALKLGTIRIPENVKKADFRIVNYIPQIISIEL